MDKEYNMKDLGIQALVGRRVKAATVNAEKDLVILDTTTGKLFLTWEGNCCAHCFLAGASGTEALKDAEILEAGHAQWIDVSRDEDNYEVLESMGSKIKTTKGYVSLETRLSHNGNYSS